MIQVELSTERQYHYASCIYQDEVITARGEKRSPIPILCRMLKERGCDPDEYIDITRGQTRVLARPVRVKNYADYDWRDDDKKGLTKIKFVPFTRF